MDVIGGNHRLKSLDTLNISVFTGYVVKCTDEQYDNLTRVDNRGGMGQNKEEAIQHCVYQHTQYGTPLTILAKKWAVDSQKLQRVVRNMELQKYLEDNHIPCENLSATVIDALNPLKDQKAVLERAAHRRRHNGGDHPEKEHRATKTRLSGNMGKAPQKFCSPAR
jgi:hypothetical protein